MTQTNWLMPIGDRECNLKIHLNSSLLHLEVHVGSNRGVHHSITENIISLWLYVSLLK